MRKLDKRAKKSSKFGAAAKSKTRFESKKPSFKSREQLIAKPRSSSTAPRSRGFGRNDRQSETRFDRKPEARFERNEGSRFGGNSRPRFERNVDSRFDRKSETRFERNSESRFNRNSESTFGRNTGSRFERKPEARSERNTGSSFKGASDSRFGGSTESRFNRSPSKGGRPSFGSSRGSFGGSSKPRKQSFRGKYIDERMFVNKGTKTTEMQDYEAKNTFADFNVAPALAKNLEKRGYIKPSPIQDQSIPVALDGKDVIGIAATGTGKTAAFLIPLINKLEKDRNQKVMILTPTRELALQIQEEFRNFTSDMKLFSVTCVGGMPIFPQMRELSRGVHVVVGTPGRVQDLINRGKIKMTNYKSIVLDEADRMLDMGFVDDMREILSQMPNDKQGLFFSATFDNKIKDLCCEFLNEPVTVSVKTRDTSGSVDQDVVRVLNRNDKIEQLHKILSTDDAKKVLIFREMKRSVDELTMELKGRGITALGLHGDMRNRERERAVTALKEGKIQALIATDVAARGIHISDISHVINYDIPNDYETYIHRIGRTGRGEAKGIALTFI